MSAEKVRCTYERCRFGRHGGQMVLVADHADCTYKKNCAAWRVAHAYEEPPPPLPSQPSRHRPIVIACGATAAIAAGGILIATTSGGRDKPVPPQPPVVAEDPALLRGRAEKTAVDLQRFAHLLLRTHRKLAVAEDTARIRNDEIKGMSPVGRTAEDVLGRVRPANEDSQEYIRISQERREEIHKDNITYIDGLVSLASFPPPLTTPLIADLRIRISGVTDEEAALDLIIIHLDATRRAGRLDEQRVFADFKKSLPPTS